jgi:hypothetical protein
MVSNRFARMEWTGAFGDLGTLFSYILERGWRRL